MENDSFIRETLGSMIDAFPEAAIELSEVMFGTSPVMKERWALTEYIDGAFEYVFSLAADNEKYRSLTAIGIAWPSVATFIGRDVPIAEAKDAFGEFANVYTSMVMDEPIFESAFGIMRQHPPEDAIRQACFPRGWAIHGKLYLGSEWVYFGYSVRKSLPKLDL